MAPFSEPRWNDYNEAIFYSRTNQIDEKRKRNSWINRFLREITWTLSDEKTLIPLRRIELKDAGDLDREVKEYEIYVIVHAFEQSAATGLRRLAFLNDKIKRFQISQGILTPNTEKARTAVPTLRMN